MGKIRRRERRRARSALASIAWVHCGYDPAARLAQITSAATTGNFNTTSARNRNRFRSRRIGKRVYNGVSIGKGHLAEAKAAINSPAAGAQEAFSRNEANPVHIGSHCGTNEARPE